MKTSPPPKGPWPPIIDSHNVPLAVRLRDTAFTIIAWIILAAMLWELVSFLWDYFSYPVFALSRLHSLDWLALWHRIASFVWLGLALALWITVLGIRRRKELRRNRDPHKVPPVTPEEQAADFGISPETLRIWRSQRILRVETSSVNRLQNLTARPRDLPARPDDDGTRLPD